MPDYHGHKSRYLLTIEGEVVFRKAPNGKLSSRYVNGSKSEYVSNRERLDRLIHKYKKDERVKKIFVEDFLYSDIGVRTDYK